MINFKILFNWRGGKKDEKPAIIHAVMIMDDKAVYTPVHNIVIQHNFYLKNRGESEEVDSHTCIVYTVDVGTMVKKNYKKLLTTHPDKGGSKKNALSY